ncbi:MAG: hypothetical protein IJE05_05395 [Clostridia bacterium]|nr:hypothetical protein [Clostridia bacterium]
MEKILKELEEMSKFNSKKEEYDLKKEEIKTGKSELEKLDEKVKLTMIGTYDREVAQSNYQIKKEELEKLEKEMSEDKEKTLKEFETQKNKVLDAINEEKGKYKYKTKDEIDALISQKNAYSKMVENSKKDVENMINDINEGKDVDMSRLKAARGEIKENSQKIENLEKEIETAKSLDEGKEILSELDYLKLKVQNMNFDNLDNIKENEFLKKYKKDEQEQEKDDKEKEEQEIDEQEKDQQEKNDNENDKGKDNENNNSGENSKVEKDNVKENKEGTNLSEKNKDNKEELSEIRSIEVKENDRIVVCEYGDGKKETISLDQIESEKKAMFKRLDIFSSCRENSRSLLGAISLYRKVNPAVIKAMGNDREAMSNYIDCLNNKKEFPFELKHDLSGMSILQKIRKNRFVRAEEKCGASILGKIFNKNKALSESKEDRSDEQKESTTQKNNDFRKAMKVVTQDRETIEAKKELEENLSKEVSQMMSSDEKDKDDGSR